MNFTANEMLYLKLMVQRLSMKDEDKDRRDILRQLDEAWYELTDEEIDNVDYYIAQMVRGDISVNNFSIVLQHIEILNSK